MGAIEGLGRGAEEAAARTFQIQVQHEAAFAEAREQIIAENHNERQRWASTH